MLQLTHTCQVTFELDNCLEQNDYYAGEQTAICSQKILALWDTKFRSALAADIKSKYENVEIYFEFSEFELESEDNHGTCVFFHKVVLSDKVNSEFIKVYVKTLVNYNITGIYLDSSFANVDEWQGKSEQLDIIFKLLKTADKKMGYFSPISLIDFIK